MLTGRIPTTGIRLLDDDRQRLPQIIRWLQWIGAILAC